jgi:hypothetical protein
MNKLSRVGIDLAKNVFQIHGVDRHGKAVWRRATPVDPGTSNSVLSAKNAELLDVRSTAS